ncbi:MAG: dihydroxy-acid dehydratase [Planctomycetes bacterium]|nr:dihydroxy-acid dehydratase [Planctomycetota bacterium]
MEEQGLSRRLTETGDREFARFIRRSFALSSGLSREALGKPAIGIVSTASDLNTCHREMPALVAAVKRGVWQAGGLPLEVPAISLGEVYLHPTSMLYRNLLSMDVEALLAAQPLDGAVLAGGCDKTVPGLLMGAASAGVPSVLVVTGPMLAGSLRGERVGACTDCRRFWARYRRGEASAEDLAEVEGQLAPTAGTCAVMGTASTMACLAEALGVMLPGGASPPAVTAERLRCAEAAGAAAVRAAREGLTPQKVLTRGAFDNALRALLAIGGSTNAVIHLAAIAGRVGIRVDLDRLDALGRETPLLVDLKPTGEGYMEDFHAAGGMPVVLSELKPWLYLGALTVSGRTLGETLDPAYRWPAWQRAIRRAEDPLQPGEALVVLKGTLAPDGALLKRSAASPGLLERTGRATVFDSLEDLAARVDREDLDVRPDDFLVLRNAGPLGGPGMPEAGYLPIPRKLAGVKDMVRISDARMSGTAFGTVVLHVAPEAAAGGPLALVRSGDGIELSVRRRALNLLVPEDELARRRAEAASRPRRELERRGYLRLYSERVQQAPLGADFDFLRHESLQGG